jgi:hypothetical protein
MHGLKGREEIAGLTGSRARAMDPAIYPTVRAGNSMNGRRIIQEILDFDHLRPSVVIFKT